MVPNDPNSLSVRLGNFFEAHASGWYPITVILILGLLWLAGRAMGYL
jgi:hypothetical protein